MKQIRKKTKAMSEMNEYQKAVAEYVKDAPQELKQYVCEMLTDDNSWADDDIPISNCGFYGYESKECRDFWYAVYAKKWLEALDTNFWKSHTQQQNPDHYKHFSCESIISMATDLQQSHQQLKPEPMTDYQQATASLMATAPDELREYVCRKVLENIEMCENCSSRNVYENQPVCCRFVLEKPEGDNFWIAVELKKWDEAMSTEFWQSYKKNQFKVSTQSNLRQAYLLTVDFKEHSVYVNPQSAFDKASEIMKNTVPPPTYIEVRGIDVIGID